MVEWENTVRELAPRLYRYFLGSFSKEIAEDLVQETLLRTVKSFDAGAFDAGQGTMAMWAFGIARNVRKEAFRSEVAIKENFPPLGVVPPMDEALDLAYLRKAIAYLPETEREVVLLHIDEFLTLNEIGIVLNMPVGTVKSHVHRAKENLKKLMGEQREELI